MNEATHVVGNLLRMTNVQVKLGEKIREGFSMQSSTVLERKKGVHAGIIVFAMEKTPFPPSNWVSRISGIPMQYLEKYDVQPKTKTRKGRKKKRR